VKPRAMRLFLRLVIEIVSTGDWRSSLSDCRQARRSREGRSVVGSVSELETTLNGRVS
jgi:hypothetical protein